MLAGAMPLLPVVAAVLGSTFGAGAGVDALDGAVVWAARAGGRPALMRRLDGQVSRIPGVRRVRADSGFRSLDLGENRQGRVIAVYIANCQLRRRCEGPFVIDVRRGGERRLTLPEHPGCATVKSMSVWHERVAYALRCPGSGNSGIYVARSGRARRVIALTDAEMQLIPSVDIGPGLVAAAADPLGVRVASTEAHACSAVVAAPNGDDLVALHVSRGRVAWVREVRGDFGGVSTTLERRAIGPDCTATSMGAPVPLNALVGGEAFVDSMAISGRTLYVSADGTIFTTSLTATVTAHWSISSEGVRCQILTLPIPPSPRCSATSST
jgi:hypothetical protein